MKQILLACWFWLTLCTADAAADQILVSAAASLRDALGDIGQIYRSVHNGAVRFNFGASNDLARQIELGAPADVFFSADEKKMAQLERKGLIEPGSRRDVLSNRLVIVVPIDVKRRREFPRALALAEVARVAVAEPSSVPAGIYARRYLESAGLWEQVREKVVPTLDVRGALVAVESGNVDAGIVYKTDAAISKKVKVAYEVPLEKGPKIVYPVAVVRESNKKEDARHFLRFVASQKAGAIFRKFGFFPLESPSGS